MADHDIDATDTLKLSGGMTFTHPDAGNMKLAPSGDGATVNLEAMSREELVAYAAACISRANASDDRANEYLRQAKQAQEDLCEEREARGPLKDQVLLLERKASNSSTCPLCRLTEEQEQHRGRVQSLRDALVGELKHYPKGSPQYVELERVLASTKVEGP